MRAAGPEYARRQLRTLIVFLGLAVPLASGGAYAACPTFAVVGRVEGARSYVDEAGSIVDPEAHRRNENLQEPVRKLLYYVETSLDAKDGRSLTTDCAFAAVEDWANKRAMTEPPRNFAGSAERQRYTIGLDVIALKLTRLGYALTDPMRHWLGFLVDSVIDIYRQSSLRNNLYTWAGVVAAGYALVAPYSRATQFEDEVWRDSIAEITPAGFLPKELTRAHRALIYHQYAFSALLMLRQMRLALGETESASDRAALQRLADRISFSLCDPQQMAAASGATQEMPDQTAYRVPDTFGDGLLDANWAKCAITPPHFNDVNLGGRLDLTARLLQRLAAAHSH